MSKKFIVLDVEGYSTCKPYDIGFKVTDKTGKTYEQHSIAVMPAIWENIQFKFEHLDNEGLKTANEMAHRNIKEILSDNKKKYIKCFDIDKLYFAFIGIIQKYKIKRIWAFNCSFDSSALHRLFGDDRFSVLCSMVEFCDIIPAILYTKLLNKDYINFCKENGFITLKGNIQTKAEVVYKYLTGNLNFEEKHTGLEDVQIETEILLTAMKETKHVKRKPCQAWKIIAEFCSINNIELPIPEFEKLIE
jgi:hypothetical protein